MSTPNQPTKAPTYEDVVARIERQLRENPVVLYMKGNPQFPSCGFSMTAVNAILKLNLDFAFVDILKNPDIRSVLPEYGDWPTFPQLWVEGELVGGCDIITEMERTGELKTLIEGAIKRFEEKEAAQANS